ncbi:MAG: cobyrinate a,c-diamide synthase [Gammaproteobacteria bacterium]|nr:MAG: cobyrinate a,c-diamide synthase [Gammaproteobacteria bacterium]
MGHIYISAAHKSSGKTSLSIALCAALTRRGLRVQPFKKGPDYIDPLWLTQAAGRSCYNLDYYTMERDEIDQTFARAMQDADVGLIEGNKGLYDGLDLDGSNSNAALAAQLDSPVVLVLDTQGMTRGVAPLILGYQAFDPAIRIGGVILNKVGGARHEAKLRRVIEHYTEVPVLGAVHRHPDMHITERHLGLVPSNELASSAGQIQAMAEHVAREVDLEALLALADSAGPVPGLAEVPMPATGRPRRVRVAYARDQAFGFYYTSDLEAFERAGAELVPFSPLQDTELPEADGLLLGGGFPETHLETLAANRAMAAAIRRFVEGGGPAYAECGGLMYLCRSLTWGAKQGKMGGIIPADVVMHERPQGRGYVRLMETEHHPWPLGGEIAAHEFHYSALENVAPEVAFAYRVVRGHGIDGKHDGIRFRNLLASYTHQRDTRRNHWVARFVDFIRECRA